jgi:glycine/D-amino acid oxidase-like deaminating enzyme
MATEKTDVVIIGAGAVGGIVAAELSKTGSLACTKIVEIVMGRCGRVFLDGDALDRSRHAGGGQSLPTISTE